METEKKQTFSIRFCVFHHIVRTSKHHQQQCQIQDHKSLDSLFAINKILSIDRITRSVAAWNRSNMIYKDE